MKLTSAMGRKVIPLLVAYLFGALTAIGVFEVRIWQHWRGEAQEKVAEYEHMASDMVERGQKQAQVVARRLAEGKGKPGAAPSKLPDGFVMLGPDGSKTILHDR